MRLPVGVGSTTRCAVCSLPAYHTPHLLPTQSKWVLARHASRSRGPPGDPVGVHRSARLILLSGPATHDVASCSKAPKQTRAFGWTGGSAGSTPPAGSSGTRLKRGFQ